MASLAYRTGGVLVAAALGACVTDPNNQWTEPAPAESTPLANFNSWVGLADGKLWIDSGVAGCPRIDPSLSVTIGGQTAAVLTEGGRVSVDASEPGHKVTNCETPQFEVPEGALEGSPVITIADDSATWTMQVDHPGVARTLHLDSPAATYKPGDMLTLHMDLAGTFSSAMLVATANGKTVFYTSSYSADAARFTIPALPELTAPTTVELSVTASIAPAVLQCDGPYRCTPELVDATRTAFTAELIP